MNRMEGARLLEKIVLNPRVADDADLISWRTTLKYWKEPILNHFSNHTTNGFSEGSHDKIKMLETIYYGLNNVKVYCTKMLPRFVPSHTCFHRI